MSEQQIQSSQSSETRLVSKEVHIQEGYTPPPMVTVRTTQLLPDETKGYTPPPMPTVAKPPAAPSASTQPASTAPSSTAPSSTE